LGNVLVVLKWNAHDFCKRFAGEVIMRWPEATTNNDCIGVFKCQANSCDNSRQVVANFELQMRPNTNGC
jgi:hypothetical protein